MLDQLISMVYLDVGSQTCDKVQKHCCILWLSHRRAKKKKSNGKLAERNRNVIFFSNQQPTTRGCGDELIELMLSNTLNL